MPDAHGHLSPAEISFILQWIINAHGRVPYPCPVSGHTTWYVEEYVTQPIVFPVQPTVGMSVVPFAMPVVRLMCTGCGHVISFSAASMGLYPQPTQPPTLPRRG